MKEDAVENLIVWIESELGEERSLSSSHIHVDDVIGGEDLTSRPDSLWVGLEAFRRAIPLFQRYWGTTKLILVIPLVCGNRCESLPLSSLVGIADAMADEPPAIYLANRELEKLVWMGEELKVSIARHTLDVPKFTHVYQRVYRDALAVEQGWEFGRAIYAEYSPPQYWPDGKAG